MKRFAIALTTLLAAMCVAGSAMAQSSVSDQLRALRERRGGSGSTQVQAPRAPSPSPAETGEGTQDTAEGAALAKAKGCLACHGIDTKVIGPSFKDVATKYEYSSDDIVKLMGSIRHGSQGTWGVSVTMPPNKRVSDEEAQKLATWILQMK